MSEILGQEIGVICHLDDILVAGQTRDDLQSRLDKVLKKLEARNVAINREKLVMNCDVVQWLGYEISKEGIRRTKEKIELISQLHEPTTVK